MKFYLFALPMMFTLLFTNSGWAATETKEEIVKSNVVDDDTQIVVLKKKKNIYEDSSEYFRLDKKYTITAQLLGANSTGTGGAGLNFGWYQNRNLIWQIETTSYNRRENSIIDASSSSIGLHLKFFTGNSFYMNGGLDLRRVDYKDEYLYVSGSGWETAGFTSESLAATYGIGNQWQWDKFTIGCEWVGVAAPISYRVSNEVIPDNLTSWSRDELNRDIKRYSSNGVMTLLKFYLGASF